MMIDVAGFDAKNDASDCCVGGYDRGLAIVMFGPPGSGKGTQVANFVNLGFSVVSVGDLLRSNVDAVIPDLAVSVGEVISTGKLLPDSFICSIVQNELLQLKRNNKCCKVIFDGFPRTIEQAVSLNNILSLSCMRINKVFNFVISDDLLVQRIVGRFSCSHCGKIYNRFLCNTAIEGVCDQCGSTEFVFRSDDNDNALSMRLLQYHEKSAPLIDFYKELDLLFDIDASCSVDEVFSKLVGLLGISV